VKHAVTVLASIVGAQRQLASRSGSRFTGIEREGKPVARRGRKTSGLGMFCRLMPR